MTDGRNWEKSTVSETKKSALEALKAVKKIEAKKLKNGAKYIKLDYKTYKLK